MARSRRGVDYLVIEYGKVECKTESDGVGRLHFGFSNVECFLVGLLGVLHDGWGQASKLICLACIFLSCQPAQSLCVTDTNNDLFGELTRFVWRI